MLSKERVLEVLKEAGVVDSGFTGRTFPANIRQTLK